MKDALLGDGLTTNARSKNPRERATLKESRWVSREPRLTEESPSVKRIATGEWLSLVEHLVRDQGVAGSNPVSPIDRGP